MPNEHLSESRTESLVLDLLNIQNWTELNRPPKGRLIRQNEYKAVAELADLFRGKSKSGPGDGYPDFLIVGDGLRPQMIIEAKASRNDFRKAVSEAQYYSQICLEAGHSTVAVGVAGQEREGVRVGAAKLIGTSWKSILYEEHEISWIPTPTDVQRLLSSPRALDLAPVVPRHDVLAEKADLINRILREATIKDEFRPAYVGAMTLGLWKSGGDLRRDSRFVLGDINGACRKAYDGAGKPEMATSLRIDEANEKLANSAWKVLAELEKLNVVAAGFDHDYLGQFYETFFRYTSGNTIGQYFTPRHLTLFMANLCQVQPDDIVIDPACGTGGFLIACIQRAIEHSHRRYEDAIRMVQNNLIGYESEPVTAALCVANMILRGDGKTGIRKHDCFTARDYPAGQCDVALMNPPFPHKKTDVPPERFIDRALEALKPRGRLAVILPTSLLVKKDIGKWRERILSKHSIVAVCQLPDECFQPYASSNTSVVVIEKGVPQTEAHSTCFAKVQYDGLALKKGVRVQRADSKSDLDDAVKAILDKQSQPGFSGTAKLTGRVEWSPGAYIQSGLAKKDELQDSIDELLRRLTSFYVRYAPEIANQRSKCGGGNW